MRTAGSILLLILLVPLTVAVFLLSTVKTNLLTAQFYTRTLAKQNTYSIIEAQAQEQIGKVKLENLPIEPADLQALALRVLPASWLQQSVEGTLDRVFVWFNGAAGTTLTLPIDLTAPKAALVPGFDALITSAIARMPECIKQSKAGELCRNADTTIASVKDMLKQGGLDIPKVLVQLPDSIDLVNPVLPTISIGNDNQVSTDAKPVQQGTSKKTIDTGKEDQKKQNDGVQQNDQKNTTPAESETLQQKAQKVVEQLTKAKEQYHRGLVYWMYFVIAYAVLVLGYIALQIKGWRRFTRWSGVGALTLGILPLAISAGTAIAMNKLLPKLKLENLPVAAQTAIPAAIRDVQHALFFPMLLISAALVVIGLGAIIGAHWIPQPAEKKSFLRRSQEKVKK